MAVKVSNTENIYFGVVSGSDTLLGGLGLEKVNGGVVVGIDGGHIFLVQGAGVWISAGNFSVEYDCDTDQEQSHLGAMVEGYWKDQEFRFFFVDVNENKTILEGLVRPVVSKWNFETD